MQFPLALLYCFNFVFAYETERGRDLTNTGESGAFSTEVASSQNPLHLACLQGLLSDEFVKLIYRMKLF